MVHLIVPTQLDSQNGYHSAAATSVGQASFAAGKAWEVLTVSSRDPYRKLVNEVQVFEYATKNFMT